MIHLTVEEITHIHKKLIEKTGGMPGLRDFGMLESAVYSTFDDIGLSMSAAINILLKKVARERRIPFE